MNLLGMCELHQILTNIHAYCALSILYRRRRNTNKIMVRNQNKQKCSIVLKHQCSRVWI